MLGFILVILCCVADFWIVKNVSGRLLVGLRWWSEIKDDGTEEWLFESLDIKNSSGMDSFIFWIVLYLSPLVWGFLTVVAALNFRLYGVTLTLVAFFMCFTNLLGYMKC